MEILRIPLLAGHILFLSFFHFKVNKLNTHDFIYLFLIVYLTVQGLVLQVNIDVMLFAQAIVTALLYFLFCSYNRSVLSKNQTIDFKKISKFIVCLLPFFLISFRDWSPLRSAGILGNPNITAHVFIMLIPFCLLIPQKRKYYFLLSLIALIGLVMFASRSALLALFLGSLIYFIVVRYKNIKLKFITYSFFLGLTVYLSYDAVNIALWVLEKLGFFSGSDSRLLYMGYNSRDILMDLALERLKGNEFWGLGFGGAKFESDGYILSTHNAYLELFLRIGYMGSAIFLSLIVSMVYKISKVKNAHFRGASLMALAVILSLSTNSSTFLVFNYLFYYLIMIYCIALYYKGTDAEFNPKH